MRKLVPDGSYGCLDLIWNPYDFKQQIRYWLVKITKDPDGQDTPLLHNGSWYSPHTASKEQERERKKKMKLCHIFCQSRAR